MGLVKKIKDISKYSSGLEEFHEEEFDDDRTLSSEDYVIVVDDVDIEKLSMEKFYILEECIIII